MGYLISRRDAALPVLNRRKLAIFSSVGLALALLAVVIALVNPVPLLARFNTRIVKGSEIYKLLESKLEGVLVQTYLFNVTNADRFLRGLDHNMKVEEVGPFTYKEIRSNVDLELDEANKVLRYSPRTSVTFMPELSVADPKDINITMPSISFLTMASMLSSYSSWTQIPFNFLVRRVKASAMVTINAYDYLWGYEDPLITFGNTVLPGWINFKTLGIMDRLYDKKNVYHLEVGASNADKFRIIKLNGIRGIEALKYDDPDKRSNCNSFVDTYEGIAYPPGMTPDTKVRIWRNVLCRILELDFHEIRPMEYGAQALVYKLSNRTYNYNPDKQCLCGDDVCYNGISDLSRCFYGLPLAISNAHFLDGEPKLFRKIEGLNPDEKIHGSQFVIEPTIGMVLSTSFTIQVNVVVKDVTFNNDAAPFSDMVVPIAYFRIVQPDLPSHQISDLKLMCITGPKLFLAGEIILFLVGISMLGYCIRQILWNAAMCGETTAMDFTLNDTEKQSQIKDSEVPLMRNGQF